MLRLVDLSGKYQEIDAHRMDNTHKLLKMELIDMEWSTLTGAAGHSMRRCIGIRASIDQANAEGGGKRCKQRVLVM